MAPTLQVLARDECYRLLESSPVHLGRLAVVDGGVPNVLPVNYRLDGEDVIMRTDPDTRVYATAIGNHVAFEVDAVDDAWREGWSVVVHGTVERVTDDGELERLQRLPLEPWAGGEKAVYLRLRATEVSGRRII